MFKRTFKVVFRPTKSNFLLLPKNYYDVVSTYDTGCLSLQFGAHVHYASWAPYAAAVKETEIGINARVAKEIGLHENDLVKCSLIGDVMVLKNVYVTPVSSKDWEIIELSSEKIASTVLDQTRIINSTQTLLIWINKSMQVALTVDRVKPKVSYGRIDHTTELIVAPKLLKGPDSVTTDGDTKEKSKNIASSNPSHSRTTAALRAAKSVDETASGTSDTASKDKNATNCDALAKIKEEWERTLQTLRREDTRIFHYRVIKGKWKTEARKQISDVYMIKSHMPKFMQKNAVYCMQTMGEKEYYVRVNLKRNESDIPQSIHATIEVNAQLMKLLEMTEYEPVILKTKPVVMNFVEKIELFANQKTHYKIVENSFKRFVIEKTNSAPVLLNQNEVVQLEEDLIVSVGIQPEHFSYCLIDAQFLKESKIYAADLVRNVDDILNVKLEEETILNIENLIKLPEFDKIIEEVVNGIKDSLCLDADNAVLRQGNVLITGPSGSGKTVLVERILDQLIHKPFNCFFDIFYCTRSKGRKVESILKDLRTIFTTCLQKAPSVVVLENLDVIAHAVGDQMAADSEYNNRVAYAVRQLITQYTGRNAIAVIATANDTKSLNQRVYSRGFHLFQSVFKIPDLERADRQIILETLCNQINSKTLDIVKFANLTEGYSQRDMTEFVQRAIFYALRVDSTNPILTNEHLFNSLENTNAYCMQGIESKKYSQGEKDADGLKVNEIPGLESVVTVLEEVIMWPSMYPGIFKNAPIRNQSGVLLYGPPGTGKTFLVSKIASSWNLRVISVKGPELLAKYIGQSEENVRNLFRRARSAKPCVIFFDEFDSLAPQRGHDSTGVTDRVVNQLLTELDGIEVLKDVSVIAATSRPELLDQALIRSGRIDRIVECTLPDASARLRIFKALSSSLVLDESVDFQWFATETENYTGADIKGMLTTANISAVKEALANCGDENPPDQVKVTQAHLMEAFKTTTPSLSAADIAKYQKAYARFTNKEKPSRDFVAKRTTLA